MKRQDLKSTRRSLKCDYCWRDFYPYAKTGDRRKKDFYEHIMRCHTDRTSSGFLEYESQSRMAKAKLNCDHCHYGRVSRQALFAHIFQTHSTAVNVEWYICEDCGKRFNQRDYLLRHTQQHLLTNLFHCDICTDDGKSWYCRRALFSHFLTYLKAVPNELKYVCDVCGFASARKRDDLWRHIVNMHMQPIDAAQFYVCNDCGSRLTTRGAMKLHVVDNHFATTICCDSCAFGITSRKSVLVLHTRTAHWPSGLRLKFECTDCNLQFNSSKMVWYHRRKEHNHKAVLFCDDCQTGKRFLTKGRLGDHQRRVHYIHV